MAWGLDQAYGGGATPPEPQKPQQEEGLLSQVLGIPAKMFGWGKEPGAVTEQDYDQGAQPVERDPKYDYGSVLPYRIPKGATAENAPAGTKLLDIAKKAEWSPEYSGVVKSLKDAFTAPGRAAAGHLDKPEEEASNAAMNLLGGGVAKTAVKGGAAAPGELAMNMYHGSRHPHTPEEGLPLGVLRDDKLNTGEGAQAYGYGHYLGERQGTAESYRLAGGQGDTTYHVGGKPVSEVVGVKPGDEEWPTIKGALQSMEMAPPDRRKIIADAYAVQYEHNASRGKAQIDPSMTGGWNDLAKKGVAEAEKLRDFFRNTDFSKIEKRQNKGHLYTIDVADDEIPKMLHFDAPYEHQTPYVQKKMDEVVDDLSDKHPNPAPGSDHFEDGKEFYDWVAESFGGGKKGEIAASKYLSEKGIPGNKFFDQNSRERGQKMYLRKAELAKLKKSGGEPQQYDWNGRFDKQDPSLHQAFKHVMETYGLTDGAPAPGASPLGHWGSDTGTYAYGALVESARMVYEDGGGPETFPLGFETAFHIKGKPLQKQLSRYGVDDASAGAFGGEVGKILEQINELPPKERNIEVKKFAEEFKSDTDTSQMPPSDAQEARKIYDFLVNTDFEYMAPARIEDQIRFDVDRLLAEKGVTFGEKTNSLSGVKAPAQVVKNKIAALEEDIGHLEAGRHPEAIRKLKGQVDTHEKEFMRLKKEKAALEKSGDRESAAYGDLVGDIDYNRQQMQKYQKQLDHSLAGRNGSKIADIERNIAEQEFRVKNPISADDARSARHTLNEYKQQLAREMQESKYRLTHNYVIYPGQARKITKTLERKDD